MIKARYPVSLALTDRGKKATVAALVLLSIGAVLRDVIVLSSSVILVGLIIVQYLRLRAVLTNLEKELILSPNEVSDSLVAGDEYRTHIHSESKMGFVYELSSSVESLFFRQGPGKKDLELVFTPLLSGNYVDTSVHFVTRDGFDLVRGERDLPFALKYKVYPRVFPVALQAVNFLYQSGASETGSSPRQFRGRGLEYLESRDYVPGDPLNVFDWKATARLARPIVKEYLVEGGGGVSVLFDSTASDPVSLDIVSSEFLRAALSLAYNQVPFEILTLDKGLIVTGESMRSSFSSVEKALMMALSGKLTDFYEYYSLLEPEKSRYSKGVFRNITRKSLDSSVGLPVKYRGRFRTEQSLIIFSSLSGDPVPLLESKEDNWLQVTVVQPTRPWLWAPSLTESIRIRVYHDKMVRVFERSGVKIVYDLQEAVDASYDNVNVPVIAK